MSMGYSAAFAQLVSGEVVKAVVGDELYGEYQKKMDYWSEHGQPVNEGYFEDFDYFGDELEMDEVELLCDTVKAVETAFKEKTGIGISLAYHDKHDTGDRYDNVDGWHWDACFSDLFAETPAYAALKEKYGDDVGKRQFYVVYG